MGYYAEAYGQETVTELLACAIHLRADVEANPEEFATGICCGVDIRAGAYRREMGLRVSDVVMDASRDKLMKRLFRQWPEYSGDMDFPVPGPQHTNPHAAFMNSRGSRRIMNRWTGEYGEARRRLLQFIIDQLTDDATE